LKMLWKFSRHTSAERQFSDHARSGDVRDAPAPPVTGTPKPSELYVHQPLSVHKESA